MTRAQPPPVASAADIRTRVAMLADRSGWLASQVARGGGSGVLTDIVVGIVGAFIGGMIVRAEGWHAPFGGYAGLIFVAFCGAVLLLILVRIIMSSTRRR